MRRARAYPGIGSGVAAKDNVRDADSRSVRNLPYYVGVSRSPLSKFGTVIISPYSINIPPLDNQGF